MRARSFLALSMVVLVAGGVLAGCSESNEADSAGGAQTTRNAPVRGNELRAEQDSLEAGSAGGGSALEPALAEPGADSAFGGNLPPVTARIIKTADLRIEVSRDGLGDGISEAVSIAGRYGGFVLSTTVTDEEAGKGSVVLRVPAESFEAAVNDLSGIGDVEEKTISGQDVSQEFVDLEARLRNFTAQEAVLLRLMDQSQTVSDTIRVQHELQSVQLEIERIKGRLRFLDDQTTMSTISASFFVPGAAPAADDKNRIAQAWDTAGDVILAVISGVIVGAAFVLPLALFGAAVFLVGLVIVRRLRPRLES